MIMIYCPFPSKEEAKKLARLLLNKKLIICANIFPVESVYIWEGKVNENPEHVMLAKTNNSKAIEFIKKEHSYDTPAIISWEAKANSKYIEWMEKELKW